MTQSYIDSESNTYVKTVFDDTNYDGFDIRMMVGNFYVAPRARHDVTLQATNNLTDIWCKTYPELEHDSFMKKT